jgi:hypothetical protein
MSFFFFSCLLTRDLSKAKNIRKKSLFAKLNKFTIIFTQSEDFFPPGPFELSFCKSAQLVTTIPHFCPFKDSEAKIQF